MPQQLQQGEGWRLGWNPDANDFRALVGANDWAVELTGPEFDDFSRLLSELLETLAQMQSELMDSEAIACEATSDLLWIQVHGYPPKFQLSFMLHHGRRAEGSWDEAATAAFVTALQTIQHLSDS
ncbi:hypothetical protein C1752_01349 [Acaryochloris thomasi RCC1774]|uniref:DUF1818 domain-containing protein n=1 Tax=Acaryochloris thomasi RCC1774 TaxID=1764569 RepID=A0A2W1JTH3_9CYAN|nr:DUF1818 family protein [Acaryochloris thomasi]PZD74385.1 hypothetical protein C1752_01349 [Acaryochloris thomasi RCC1774]